MYYYVYILYGEQFDKFYIGQTNNIIDRLQHHNSGTEKSTKPYVPWKMFWHTEKTNRAAAMILEKK